MSSPLALAAAMRMLARLLDEAVAAEGLSPFQNSATTVLSPEFVDGGTAAASKPQLNLFPFHFATNGGWTNRDLPNRNGSGDAIERPPLALDVHVMLSAHAAVSYQAEALLGIGLRAFHDEPVLLPARIQALLAPPVGNTDALVAAIANARVADQFERLKLTPLNLSPADMQTMWQSLHGRYRPSVAFLLSTVLIDSRLQPKSGLPVRDFGAAVIPFDRPLITAIEPPQILYDGTPQTIVLRGESLVQPGAVARFASGERVPLDATSAPTRAVLTLPATLPAGLIGIDIARRIDIGASPAKEVNASNTVVLIHRPMIARTPAPANAPDIAVIAAGGGAPRRLSIRLAPAPRADQGVELLLNRAGDPASDGLVVTGVTGQGATPDIVIFPLPDGTTGNWIVRVRVAGAETPLDIGPDGSFAGPVVGL